MFGLDSGKTHSANSLRSYYLHSACSELCRPFVNLTNLRTSAEKRCAGAKQYIPGRLLNSRGLGTRLLRYKLRGCHAEVTNSPQWPAVSSVDVHTLQFICPITDYSLYQYIKLDRCESVCLCVTDVTSLPQRVLWERDYKSIL